jgi:YggT family protein
MHALAVLLINLTWAYLALFFVRMIMSWVFAFAPNYRAGGVMAMVLEVTYTLTDPPLRFLRRLIPPLRIGSIALDLAFYVVVVVLYALARVVWPTIG